MSIFRALLFAIIAFVDIASGSQHFPASEIDEPVYDENKPGLYIYAFNTGQANCIVMRHGNNSYIVDAGCQSLREDFYANLGKMLTGSTLKYVFITHPHTDHYNLLNDVLRTFDTKQKENTEFYLGGMLDHYKSLNIPAEPKWIKRTLVTRDGIIYDPSKGNIIYTAINSRHLRDPNIDFENSGLSFKIIPSSVEQKTKDKNTYSYMLLVTYNGRNILFGGDYILKEGIVSTLKLPKLDIVFLPHHGSVRTMNDTELLSEPNVNKDDQYEIVDGEKCDISDNNEVSALSKVEEKGELPCLFFICGGTNSNVKDAEIFKTLFKKRETIKPHNICLRDLKGPLGANDTTRPLFTTQGAKYGFYGIRINQRDGSIEMCGINGTEWDTPFTKTVGKRETETYRTASLSRQNRGNK